MQAAVEVRGQNSVRGAMVIKAPREQGLFWRRYLERVISVYVLPSIRRGHASVFSPAGNFCISCNIQGALPRWYPLPARRVN